MFQNIPIPLYNRPHTAKIYAVTTDLKGDTEVSRVLSATVKCHAHCMSSAELNAALGATDQNRLKVILPLKKDDGMVLTVKYGYQIEITFESGPTRHEEYDYKVSVERVWEYPESHIEVEAVDVDL